MDNFQKGESIRVPFKRPFDIFTRNRPVDITNIWTMFQGNIGIGTPFRTLETYLNSLFAKALRNLKTTLKKHLKVLNKPFC